MLHAKKVATTTGPSTAWFRNTFQANGAKLAAKPAPAAAGNALANAAYQKCCRGP
jgi:hypothetical protein